jgi:hypothetical protein
MNIPITIDWPTGKKTYQIGYGPSWLHWTGEVWYPGGANKLGDKFKMCNQTNEQDDCSGGVGEYCIVSFKFSRSPILSPFLIYSPLSDFQ